MTSLTERLQLLMKDPVADGNETFNIETMLNDNWRIIDALVALKTEVISGTDVDQKINAAIANLISGSPAALDTLNELAAALGDDPNFATTMTNLIATKYVKPANGIPKADLEAGVQASLDEADTALTSANKYTDDKLTEHAGDTTKHITPEIAKFKQLSSTFTTRGTSQTFTDAFCTASSLVTVVITSAVKPQGIWTVNSANGSFTITSDKAETADITFDYYVQKAVG